MTDIFCIFAQPVSTVANCVFLDTSGIGIQKTPVELDCAHFGNATQAPGSSELPVLAGSFTQMPYIPAGVIAGLTHAIPPVSLAASARMAIASELSTCLAIGLNPWKNGVFHPILTTLRAKLIGVSDFSHRIGRQAEDHSSCVPAIFPKAPSPEWGTNPSTDTMTGAIGNFARPPSARAIQTQS